METSNEYLKQLQSKLKDYQNDDEKKGKVSGKDILKKFFTPRDFQETFRPLPPQGDDLFTEAYFHLVDLNAPNGKKNKWRAVYCPAHNDPMIPRKNEDGTPVIDQNGKPVMAPSPCPLCEKSKAILKTQKGNFKGKKREDLNEEEKELWDKNKEIYKESKNWEARKYFILRGIDQGNTKDGVKFWRFKDNYKKQGTYDKLMPVLNQYIQRVGAAYFDPEKGCDLDITMSESEVNGRPVKNISAIIYNGPKPLHHDPIVVKQWINDPITWRDVFKPKSAPNITPHQFLELLAEGNDPYWDDSDENNKHWVFPNNPELQAKANERSSNLDADDENYSNHKLASDLRESNDSVTVTNVTAKDVGEFENKSVPKSEDITNVQKTEPVTVEADDDDSYNNSDSSDDSSEYDDLPF